MISIASRVALTYCVAQRYRTAGSLGLGRTFQNEKIRIHRYSNSLKVTDLTNAGKRGKKCDEMTVMPTHYYKGDHDEWLERMAGLFVDEASGGYKAIARFIKDVQQDFPTEISIEERPLKALSVEPYGEIFEFELPQSDGGSLRIKSSPIEFSVVNRVFLPDPSDPNRGFFDDTHYYSRKREDGAAFYAWMKETYPRVRNVDLATLREVWHALGIRYDSH